MTIELKTRSNKLKICLMALNMISSNIGLGSKLRNIGYFANLLHPKEETLGYYFPSGICLRALEIHVLLSFLWSIFCK